jgi:urea transport system substrate-binding protein
MSEEGGSVKRWVLAGTDYVYPRTTNKILEAYLKSKGVAEEDIMINYTPFGHSDWQTIVSDIKKFGSAGKKTAVVSTINGDANVPFYKELGNQGIKAEDIPVVAFSVGEEELAGLDTAPLVGHLAAWNYFQSVEAPVNASFIEGPGRPSSRTTSVSPTTRWKPTTSASTCGSKRSRRPAAPTRMRWVRPSSA